MPSRPAEIKILWWIDHLGSGGAQQILTRLIEHMAQQGAKQSVICLSTVSDDELTRRIVRAGATLHIIGKKRLLFGIGLLRTWHLLREQRFDASVSFLFNSDVIGTLMSWLGKVPARISAQRSSNDHYSRFRSEIIRLVLKKTTCIVLNNNAYRVYAKRILPDRIPVCVIPNGVDIRREIQAARGNWLHAELLVSPDTPLIGCVGRLSAEKRVEDVIRAMALLEDNSIHLVLIGDGPQKKHLVRVAESLDLADRVRFSGERQDIPAILDNLSLYVLASSFEGMSNSLMEAMVAGCPVAVSAIDANLTLVGNNTRGWAFQVGDIQGLAGVVTAILNSPEQVNSRTRAARKHIEKSYTEWQMLKAWHLMLKTNTGRSLQL